MKDVQYVLTPNAANPDDLNKSLSIYVIYGPGTSDFPGKFVVRRQIIKSGLMVNVDQDPTGTADTLEEVRKIIPPGKTRIMRHEQDDPNIVECWL